MAGPICADCTFPEVRTRSKSFEAPQPRLGEVRGLWAGWLVRAAKPRAPNGRPKRPPLARQRLVSYLPPGFGAWLKAGTATIDTNNKDEDSDALTLTVLPETWIGGVRRSVRVQAPSEIPFET